MKFSTVQRISTWAFWIFATLAALVFVLWIGSYFSGTKLYRSHWSQSAAESQERARWWFSDGGACIVAWRSQSVIPKLESLPEPQAELSTMTESDRVSLGVTPITTFAFWHWFRFTSRTTPMGASSTTYSQLVIPWWSLFLLLLIITSAIYRSGSQDQSDPP